MSSMYIFCRHRNMPPYQNNSRNLKRLSSKILPSQRPSIISVLLGRQSQTQSGHPTKPVQPVVLVIGLLSMRIPPTTQCRLKSAAVWVLQPTIHVANARQVALRRTKHPRRGIMRCFRSAFIISAHFLTIHGLCIGWRSSDAGERV